MARKRSKKKTDFNQYLPWIIVGALVLGFIILGAGPTGKFLDVKDLGVPSEEPLAGGEFTEGKEGTPREELTCLNPIPEDQDCDHWLGENDCDDNDGSVGPWIAIYADKDNDGSGSGRAQNVCAEIENFIPKIGYSLYGNDCDDNNALIGPNCIDYRVGTIFVSSNTYNGDLGGLSGADSKCTLTANTANVVGSWTALLSDSNVDARDRIPDTTYYNTNSDIIANDKSALFPKSSYCWNCDDIKYDERGGLASGVKVWTASSSIGQYSTQGGQSCGDWTVSRIGNVRVGETGSTGGANWISRQPSNCALYHHLYCVRTS